MSNKLRQYQDHIRDTLYESKAKGVFSRLDHRIEEEGNGRLLSVQSQAKAARQREIGDIRKRITRFLPVMSDDDRKDILRSLGVDIDLMQQAALSTARQQVARENRNLTTRPAQPVVVSTADVAYREVAELYKLVQMIKDRVLTIDNADGLVLAEAVTLKDLASFTNAVNNLYGTYMKCKDLAKLHEDINKITEALKQAMKEMPQEYVNRFMTILTSFDDV